METDKSRVLTATKQLMDTLSSVIDKCAKEVEQDGAIKFSHNSGRPDKGIRQATMPVAELYVDWLTAVGVKTRKEMDELLASFSDDSEMLKCAEDLQKVEQRFDALTKQVNVVVQQEEDTVLRHCMMAIINVKSISSVFYSYQTTKTIDT